MSGKRFDPKENPPAASSSDEEGSSIREGEEDYSTEDEEVIASSKMLEPEKEQASDSESGSDHEEEYESESEPPVAKPEPVAKQVTKTNDAVVRKQESKKAKISEKSGVSKKRANETDGEAKDAKKVKKVSAEEEKKKGTEETKKTFFQRKWTEEDEITVLQGFIDYTTEKKVSPYDDPNAFYQSLKDSISIDVVKNQFMEKVRNLKKKFETNLGKAKNGEEPNFSKSHDRKTYELSKLIWGVNGMAPETAVKSNGKSKKSASKLKKVVSKEELVSSLLNGKEETSKGEEVVSSYLVKSLPRFGMDGLAAQQGWSKLSSEDKKSFEEQWEALQVKEFELYSKKSGFIHEVVTKMAEAFQSNP